MHLFCAITLPKADRKSKEWFKNPMQCATAVNVFRMKNILLDHVA